MKDTIEEKSFLKISTASKDIDVNPNEYHDILETMGMPAIPPIKGKKKGEHLITIDVHEQVKENLKTSVQKNSGEDIAIENKDFKRAMDLFEQEIKKNKTTHLVKRREPGYYTSTKLAEIKSIIAEVNKKIVSSRIVLPNGYETIKFNEFMESTYYYSKHDPLPKLKIRANEKYGYQIYLEYFAMEEVIKNGKIVKEKKIKHLTGYLNRTDEKKLYWSAIFTAMFIYNKIKLGYYIKLRATGDAKWNTIATTPPSELYLVPTLLAYLEHFKRKEFKTTYASTLRGNINHLIRFLHPSLSANRKIRYEELNHQMKFTKFSYQKVTKFIEYLRTTNTSRTKKPPTGRTITNIISDLGNLVTHILNMHEPTILDYKNPFLKHKIRVEERQMHPVYSPEQLQKLIKGVRDTGDIQLLAIAFIIYYTGCRRVEAERLKIKNIELEAEKIRFYRLIEAGRTKTTDRTITLHKDLKNVLASLNLEKYDKEDYLFTADGIPGATQVSRNYFQEHFRKLKVKIPELTEKHGLYGLKHTFATNFLKSAKSQDDLEDKKVQLQQILGHQNFKETLIYVKGLDLSDLFPQSYDGLQRLEE
ncbi:MAG TPA: tyrosine-type recombinase/integrase [Bacteroidia bacterium]|jgi:integrase|nr:tyrosine-type recombinase/integrase [Bacteroidia bacterium]